MKRMNVSFNQKAYEALEKLESESGIGKSEILRNAIALISFIEEKKSEGYKIATIKNGEIKQEIVIP
jgi:metal-responsive CopG/Arc/MetJ family transcriptional regulator